MGTNRAFERCNSEFCVITGRKPSSWLLVGCTTRGKCRDKWSYLTKDLNTISEGIPFGYIDLNGKPIEPCSCSCLMKVSLGYVNVS
jgi:hypothetical protein